MCRYAAVLHLAPILLLSCREASAQFKLPGLPIDIQAGKVAEQLGAVATPKAAEALKDTDSGSVAKVLKDSDPSKLSHALEDHGQGQKASDMMQAVGDTLHHATEGLPPPPKEVQATLDSTGKVGSVVKDALSGDMVKKLRHADPSKVDQTLGLIGGKIQELVKSAKAGTLGSTLRKDEKEIEEALEAMKTAVWWETHWPWVLLTLAATVILCAGSAMLWVRRARLKRARSPNLLVDAEIDMYVHSGFGRARPAPEGPLFRQF